MESLISSSSTASRDILAEELTNLRSLLRLNGDGIGEEADLISQLNQSGTPPFFFFFFFFFLSP